jgi:hypothetical protein
MRDLLTWDTTLQVGDLVFSTYHKGETLFKIIKIEKRFITQYDMMYATYQSSPYYGHSVGDEYNPYVTIEAVASLSIVSNLDKKKRKYVAGLDGFYLKRATPDHIEGHLKRLQKLIDEFWP